MPIMPTPPPDKQPAFIVEPEESEEDTRRLPPVYRIASGVIGEAYVQAVEDAMREAGCDPDNVHSHEWKQISKGESECQRCGVAW